MHEINNTHASAPLSCNDLKAVMSAYLDDELTRDERLRTDAHLVGCGSCRSLVERAEALDETLREKFALDTEDAARSIDPASVDTRAMQAQVFAAIGAPSRRRSWIPRLGIATAVAAAVAGAALVSLQFLGLRGTDGQRALERPARLVTLDADERQLLYSTGVILHNLRREGFERSEDRTQLREVARYDELVQRLDAIITKLPLEDRPAVALARETIEFLLDASDDPARWEEIRRDMEATELDRKVDGLSDA